jgi:hypothetical protein
MAGVSRSKEPWSIAEPTVTKGSAIMSTRFTEGNPDDPVSSKLTAKALVPVLRLPRHSRTSCSFNYNSRHTVIEFNLGHNEFRSFLIPIKESRAGVG